MQVFFADEFGIDTEFFRPGADAGQRGVGRFLHYFAELSGQAHLALTFNQRRFDLENVTAYFGPGQAVNQTDLAAQGDVLFAELDRAEQVAHFFGRDDFAEIAVIFGVDQFTSYFAHEGAELAFQAADARLACV